jgi:hypothetical protein
MQVFCTDAATDACEQQVINFIVKFFVEWLTVTDDRLKSFFKSYEHGFARISYRLYARQYFAGSVWTLARFGGLTKLVIDSKR